ncbi:hypothetical protein B0O99DRAFT_632471 [Bisporella sp. PMI_857]|nr:hypothetical protein B0O99DRAFT_632471 [Bisporella sp. PMI_857]
MIIPPRLQFRSTEYQIYHVLRSRYCCLVTQSGHGSVELPVQVPPFSGTHCPLPCTRLHFTIRRGSYHLWPH